VREIEERDSRQTPAGDAAGGREWLSDPQLLTALRSLTELSREVILLHYVADLSIAEIAVATDRRAEAVRKVRNRALAELRVRLSRLDGQPRTRPDRLPMRRLHAAARGLLSRS
jgi:DNA-directed RNA polymerase specialized sigma24 family protein